MNIKKKLALFFFILIVATGCDGVYNLEIYDNKYREDATITETNTLNWYDKNENGVSFRDFLDEEYNRDNYYYHKTMLSDSSALALNYKSDFDLNAYSSLGLPYRCYDYFNIIEEDTTILISTSNKNQCYERYKWLDNITVNLKTNHKVLDNNADSVKGNTYTWNLTRENASDKSLQIKISKYDFVNNYDNEIAKNALLIIGIVLTLAIIVALAIFIIRRIQKNANKV